MSGSSRVAALAILDDYQGVALAMAPWERLASGVSVRAYRDHLADEAAVVERLKPYDAVVLMRERTPFPRRVIESLPGLRLVVTTGMRNRALDVAACRERGIAVCGTEALGAPTVELTWGLILALARRIPVEDRAMRDGRWQTTVGNQLAGNTLGVLGLGRVGRQVARVAHAFDMRVIAWSQNMTVADAAAAGAVRVEKDRLFAEADAVTIHVVLSERTRGLVGARELALMKPSAHLVNTSRGPIVDEGALIAALRSGTIAGAGLDVFDIEPLSPAHPLLSLPNTVLTPHLGYVTQESYRVFYQQALEDVEAWLAGSPVRTLSA